VPSIPNSLLLISSEFPPNVGGIGNHSYNLAKALSREGFKVTVVADIIDVDKNELDDFASQQDFAIHWIRRQQPAWQTYLARIVKTLSLAKNAEKVICSGKFSLWLGILLSLRFPRIELIAVVHGTELDLKFSAAKQATSYALAKFAKIISVSTYTQKFLPNALPSSIKKYIIHNGIDGSEFNVDDSEPLAGQPALITVGNVTDRKGQENVIAALPRISAIYPQVAYHIVGRPTNKVQVESMAKRLQIDHQVSFYGAVSRQTLLRKLHGATIKLMLSNHTHEGDFEGFGIAVLEANACGVPAIGSKDCGIADAIEHGKTGLLVDQQNATEVANAVKTIMDNYACFSDNAKNWAVQHDWKIIVKKYVEVLNAC
jgi:phosphatidylinositol alpha-1,6-mannosyltransferase